MRLKWIVIKHEKKMKCDSCTHPQTWSWFALRFREANCSHIEYNYNYTAWTGGKWHLCFGMKDVFDTIFIFFDFIEPVPKRVTWLDVAWATKTRSLTWFLSGFRRTTGIQDQTAMSKIRIRCTWALLDSDLIGSIWLDDGGCLDGVGAWSSAYASFKISPKVTRGNVMLKKEWRDRKMAAAHEF